MINNFKDFVYLSHKKMNLILNILWLALGGLPLAIEWLICGVLSIVFIITIPFTRGCFEMASACLTPFGKEVVEQTGLGQPPRPIAGFFWIIFFGIWLAISHIIVGIAMCLTVIGIPLGLQNFKLAQVAFNPYKYTLREKQN
ncbi:YccF domain-containing protein [Cetobacterium sp. 8H]|uniref:YccF domain-containing protein n=1 Tax=Cetobacterium sp. 8H TaxID=2759681 RepID=UPI00351B93CD